MLTHLCRKFSYQWRHRHIVVQKDFGQDAKDESLEESLERGEEAEFAGGAGGGSGCGGETRRVIVVAVCVGR